jgi:hypothetical protein
MPGSWERFRIGCEIEQSADTDPPEPTLRRVFLLPGACFEIPGETPERETRIPGLARERARPKRAGPAGGNEAMSRTPMAERALTEFAK